MLKEKFQSTFKKTMKICLGRQYKKQRLSLQLLPILTTDGGHQCKQYRPFLSGEANQCEHLPLNMRLRVSDCVVINSR